MNKGPGTLELDYAKPLRWHQRRWLVWVLLAASLVALYVGWRTSLGPRRRFSQKWAVRQNLRACMVDAPGPEVVAFEGHPRSVQWSPGYAHYVGGRSGRVPMYAYHSTSRRLEGQDSPPRMYDPVLFLHARQAPGGPQRLVVVQGWLDYPGAVMNLHLSGQIWSVDVPFGSDPFEVARFAGPVLSDRPPEGGTTTLRVFAGQADPQDASHFTIEYWVDGKRGVVDGWLRAPTAGRAEKVELKVRN
jgi:hypothetical protein